MLTPTLIIFLSFQGICFGNIILGGPHYKGDSVDMECNADVVGLDQEVTNNVLSATLLFRATGERKWSIITFVNFNKLKSNPNDEWRILVASTHTWSVEFPTEQEAKKAEDAQFPRNAPALKAVLHNLDCRETGEFTCSIGYLETHLNATTSSTVTVNKTENLVCLDMQQLRGVTVDQSNLLNPQTIPPSFNKSIEVDCNAEASRLPQAFRSYVYAAYIYYNPGSPGGKVKFVASVDLRHYGSPQLDWKVNASLPKWVITYPTEQEAIAATVTSYPRRLVYLRAKFIEPKCDGFYFCQIRFLQKSTDKNLTMWTRSDRLSCREPPNDDEEDDSPDIMVCAFMIFASCCGILCVSGIAVAMTVLTLTSAAISIIVQRSLNVITIDCLYDTTIKNLADIVQCHKKVMTKVEENKLIRFGFFFRRLHPDCEVKGLALLRRMVAKPMTQKILRVKIKMVVDKKRHILYFVVIDVKEVNRSGTVIMPSRTSVKSTDKIAKQLDPVKFHLRKLNVTHSELQQHGTPV